MRQRRTLQLWQLIVLLGILAAVLVSMLFPVIHLDKEVVKDVASDVIQRAAAEISEQDPTGLLGSTLLEPSGLEKELDEQLDRRLENVDLDMSWSCLDIMTARDGLAEGLSAVRVYLWLFYLAAVLLLVLLLVVFFCKRTKYAAVIPIAAYGTAGLAGSGIAFWRVPNYLADRMYTDVLADLVSYFGGDRAVGEKAVREIFVSLWSDMLSPGMYLIASLFLLLLVLSVVIGVTGSRCRESAPQLMSRGRGMRCIRGELSGAEIPVDSIPLYVGRDPKRCQLVLQNSSVGAVHFSIWYDAARGGYQVACYDERMLYGPVPPGTQLKLCGDSEIFELL